MTWNNQIDANKISTVELVIIEISFIQLKLLCTLAQALKDGETFAIITMHS